MGDDTKRIILARRARYMAAAVASIAASGCAKGAAPADGADAAPIVDAGAAAHPCLSPVHMRQDAAAITPEQLALLAALGDASPDADAVDAASLPAIDVKIDSKVSSGKLPHGEANARAGLLGRARACYARVLQTDPTARGSVVLELKVSATGDVDSVGVKTSDVAPSVATCVASVARKIRFEGATAPATVTVTATFAASLAR